MIKHINADMIVKLFLIRMKYNKVNVRLLSTKIHKYLTYSLDSIEIILFVL